MQTDDTSQKDESHMMPAFIGDVLERETSSNTPPSAPVLKSKNGFPSHTKGRAASRFKQKQEGAQKSPPAIRPSEVVTGSAPSDKEQIDDENQALLDQMSSDEIEAARQEIMSSLDPGLLQRLLRRSNINSGSNEAAGSLQHVEDEVDQSTIEQPIKRVAFETPAETEDAQDSIHFPQAPQPPDLDPASETFLDDLHTKYFPSLPAEPDKLDWMRSSSAQSSYNTDQSTLNPGEIRFSFKGELIPPSRAANIPVSQGLHHHGDAPDAAGYTIPELAHLSRSIYAPQRCIAFQTLGRILYRLGKGEFGDPGEPGGNTVLAQETMGELARGLWTEIERQHVISQLIAESEGNGVDGGRHVSAKAYATEAVWLWRKGGGRRWKAD